MKKIRYGMIGCGDVSIHNAKAIAEAENSTTEMVMDVKEELAKSLADEFSTSYTTDLDELLGNANVDAVYIAVPHHLHYPIALKAAQAGKQILLEKAIAHTVEDSEKIIAAAKEHRVKLMIAMAYRYIPAIQKIKKLLDEGSIGKICGLHIPLFCEKSNDYWKHGYSGRIDTDWRIKREKSGGGILIMNLYHNLDYWLNATGLEPVEVNSRYDTFLTDVEVEDYIAVTLRFSNNAIGTVTSSSCALGGSPEGCYQYERLIGTEGQLVLQITPHYKLSLYSKKETRYGAAMKWNAIAPDSPDANSRTVMVDNFSESLLNGVETPAPGEEVLMVQKICEAAYESGKSGVSVKI